MLNIVGWTDVSPGAYPSGYSLALPAIIILGWKRLTATNPLACAKTLVIVVNLSSPLLT
jgi:hypothetical protein